MNNTKQKHNYSQDPPFVSIIVITYNSVKFVLETLESAKAQTYQNIELVISDDCSTDNTVEICRKWIENNANHFVRTEIVTTVRNTGIAPNCNRGVKAAHGEWIKLIAGDDILLQACIEKNIDFITANPNIKVIHSQLISLNTDGEQLLQASPYPILSVDYYTQYKQLLKRNWINAPTVFINRRMLLDCNGFNEAYPMIEDYPLWLKLFKANIKFGYLAFPTVLYRENENSVTQNLFSRTRKCYLISYLKLYRDIIYNELLKNKLFISYINFKIEHFVLKHKVLYNRNLSFLLHLKPSNYYKYVRKQKCKK